jgi:lysophospholipase L1-like esterase
MRMATKYNVITWGDSGGCGWGDFQRERGGGVPARLEQDFHAENYDAPTERFLPTFHNNSVYGTTALTLRRRINTEMEARRRDAPILNIVSIGMNDAMRRAKNNHVLMRERTFARSMKVIGKHAMAHDGALVYIGVTSFEADVVNPYRNKMILEQERVKRFEQIACEVTSDLGGTAIALFEASQEVDFSKIMVSADGLHPNSDGYDWIHEQVAPVVHRIWK